MCICCILASLHPSVGRRPCFDLRWIGLCTSFTSCVSCKAQLLAWISPAFNALLLIYVASLANTTVGTITWCMQLLVISCPNMLSTEFSVMHFCLVSTHVYCIQSSWLR